MGNITMEDVARQAGVSRATVSRVLRNLHEGTSIPISEETRQRVLTAVKELDYCPHFLATSLASGKSRTVGFVCPEGGLRDWDLVEIYQAVATTLLAYGYHVLIPPLKPEGNPACIARNLLRSGRADGLLVCCMDVDEHWDRLCSQEHDRVVFINSSVPHGKAAHVATDDRQGASAAILHLLDSGHTRIVFVGDLTQPPVQNRHLGYQEAFQQRNLSCDPEWTMNLVGQDFHPQEVVERCTQRSEPVTAIFAGTDYLAIRLLKAASDSGISVPRQLAIMGFDDLWPSGCVSPALSTVRRDAERIGQEAVEHLLQGMSGHALSEEPRLIACSLVLRESA